MKLVFLPVIAFRGRGITADVFAVDEAVSLYVITDADGRGHDITMVQRWPVKQAVRCYREKPRPSRVMETGVRAIDTFNPLAEGGTGFIPGPFGAGKTVLQHAISKQADADVIIIVACGERANEVVEIFKDAAGQALPQTAEIRQKTQNRFRRDFSHQKRNLSEPPPDLDRAETAVHSVFRVKSGLRSASPMHTHFCMEQ